MCTTIVVRLLLYWFNLRINYIRIVREIIILHYSVATCYFDNLGENQEFKVYYS